jgi:hypothetical protein
MKSFAVSDEGEALLTFRKFTGLLRDVFLMRTFLA